MRPFKAKINLNKNSSGIAVRKRKSLRVVLFSGKYAKFVFKMEQV